MCAPFTVPSMKGLECKNWGDISVKVAIFDRWELAVGDKVYIRNRSRSNIGVQTFQVHRPTIHISTGFLNIVWEYFYFNGP